MSPSNHPPESDPSNLVPLHPLELRILIAVSKGPSHGYRIVKEVESAEGERFTLYPANLYRRIRSLSSGRLLEEVEAPEDEAEADRRRTYFRITPLGRAVVREETRRLEALARAARAAMEPA